MPLKVNVYPKDPGCYVVAPSGSIDSNSYAILEKEVDAVLASSPKMLILDMEGVSFLSSAGVRIILKAKKSLKETTGTLVMMKLQPQIKKVFDIMNALPSQAVFTSTEELDAYLARMQRKQPDGGF